MPRTAPRIEKHRDTADAASDGAVRSLTSVSLPQPASGDDAILAPWEFNDGEDEGSDFSPNASPRPAKTKFSGGDKPKPSKRQARRSEQLRGSWTRAVRFKSRDIYTGDVPMARLGGKLMSGEGLNEIHAWIVLDFHLEDMVEAWAQPDLMKIKMFGVSHNWTPDARVALKDSRDLLIEVKPLEVLQPDEAARPEMAALMREKIDAWAASADEACRDFLLLSEREIYLEPRFHNAKTMLRAHGSQITADVLRDAIAVLPCLGEVASVWDLADLLPQHRSSTLMIACLLDWDGHIRLDRREFFAPDIEFENYLAASSDGGEAAAP